MLNCYNELRFGLNESDKLTDTLIKNRATFMTTKLNKKFIISTFEDVKNKNMLKNF